MYRKVLLKELYLLAAKFNLKVLGGLLRHTTPKVKLIHLTHLIPHGRLVVHDKLSTHWRWIGATGTAIRFDLATFKL